MVRIKIFHEKEKSLRRAFSLYIKPDKNRIAELGLKKTIVYIEEVGRRTGVTFPLKPRVVSLQDYDDLSKAARQPIQGYPLICVTVCLPFTIFSIYFSMFVAFYLNLWTPATNCFYSGHLFLYFLLLSFALAKFLLSDDLSLSYLRLWNYFSQIQLHKMPNLAHLSSYFLLKTCYLVSTLILSGCPGL